MIKPQGLAGPSPFICFCQKVIPLAYDESMSYYEAICALMAYLKNQVIPALNNNAEAVTELQGKYLELKEYVDTYFENLDVQDEINAKLDDMAEKGQLAEIIAEYLETQALMMFNTLRDLKSADNIKEGSFVKTLGLNSYKDGKGNYYKIRNITNKDVIDNDKLVSLEISDTLVAEKVLPYAEREVKPLSGDQELYLASFFDKDNPAENYLYSSTNGKQFKRLSSTPWVTARDVDIIEYDNKFYAISLQSTGDKSIGMLYVSEDLVNWKNKPLYVDLQQPDSYRNYPCDWFIDDNGKVYLVGAYKNGTMQEESTGTTFDDFRIFIVEVLNMDFDNFELGEPNKLTQLNMNLIDPTICKHNNEYYMFVKKEASEGGLRGGTIRIYKSSDLENWTLQVSAIPSISAYHYEAPSVCKVGNKYFLYVDNYNADDGSYFHYLMSDNLIDWSDRYILQSEGYATRHGSVSKITSGVLQKNIMSYSEIKDLTYYGDYRKMIVLPSITSSTTNKSVEICRIKNTLPYKCLSLRFTLKELQNWMYESDYYLSVRVGGTNDREVQLTEKTHKYDTNLNRIEVVDTGTEFILYFNSLSNTNTTPCIVIEEIIGSAFNVKFNEDIQMQSSKASGTSYHPVFVSSYNNMNTQFFRIESIGTGAGENSITATFTAKANYQSFSAFIFGRNDCLLFQAQVGGDGNFIGVNAFDLTGRNKSYTTSTTSNSVTVGGLSTYDEYTLMINDTSNYRIKFSK